jgi:hypothetical protein
MRAGRSGRTDGAGCALIAAETRVHVAAERGRVAENRRAADPAVVRDVRIGHEQVVVADGGQAASANRAAMDRHELTEHVVMADDEARRFAAVLDVLRCEANRRQRRDVVVIADFRQRRSHWTRRCGMTGR